MEIARPIPEFFGDSGSGTMGDRAPMQGDITHIYVESGALVEKGDPLLALESMKMEVRDYKFLSRQPVCLFFCIY